MVVEAQTLVGRDQELVRLTQLLDGVREGVPAFAEVTGEPGIGKTSILDEIGRRADAEGFLVLSGRCSEFEQELPFALVIDAFDAYLASLNPQDFDRLASEELTELAGLFPSLRALAPESADPSTPGERFRAHRAMVALIERLAARQPVLLLLDDLHWADGASIEQAAYVLRRPPAAGVMIIGSYRTGQADPSLVAAIQAASRAGGVTHVQLGPLDRPEARTLVGSASDNVYEQSGGNPFYILQLVRSEAEGHRRVTDGRGVPMAITASIASELEGLGTSARVLVDAGSVAGDPFDLDLAVAAAELEERTALEAIDELISRDLIRPTSTPRRFQFRHPLVRTAVYERCPAGSRLAAHERASEVLAARGAPAIELAHHVEHAARHGDMAAVEVLRQAGDAAAGRAPSSAARWYGAAVRLLPNDAPDDIRLSLLMALAGAQAATGHLEEARAAFVESIDLATDDGPIPRVRVIAACAGIEQLLGRHELAHQRLTDSLEELPQRDSAEAASLLIDLAVDAFFGARFDEMCDHSIEALTIAEPLGDGPLTATAASVTALACALNGPVSEAEGHGDDATARIDAMADEELAIRLDAISWLCAAEFYLDRYASGTAHAERGLRLARETGQGELLPGLTQALANLLFCSGRVIEATKLLDEAVDAARLTDNAVGLAWSLLNRSYAAVHEGDIATAVSTGREAMALSDGLIGSVVAAWAGAVTCAALLEAGEPAAALQAMIDRGGGEEASTVPGHWRSTWLCWMARAQLGLGRLDDAATSAARARARAEEFPLPLARASASGAEAFVALARDEAEEAARLALEAAGHAEEMGARVEAARWHALAGRALAASGENERAIEELERAASEFDACASTRYRDEAERELGKLGRRAHRRTKAGEGETGVASLTGRELEIARLVVDRRTNPEIASELFLSVKTVETHMRNIFRKLDVSSRVDVAKIVEQADP